MHCVRRRHSIADKIKKGTGKELTKIYGKNKLIRTASK